MRDTTTVIMLTWEFPPRIIGGIASHVYNLTRALTKLGVKVHVVTCDFPDAAVYEEIDDVISNGPQLSPETGVLVDAIVEPVKPIQLPKDANKTCPEGKELNPKTNRCVSECKDGFVRDDNFQCKNYLFSI